MSDGKSRVGSVDFRALHERYAKGATVSSLSRESGVRIQRIYAEWRALGLPFRGNWRRTPFDAESTFRRYLAGETAAAIAKDVGVQISSLYTAWRRNGLQVDRSVRPRDKRARTKGQPRINAQETHERYLAGEAVAAIAAELHVHEGSIWNAWKRAGLSERRLEGAFGWGEPPPAEASTLLAPWTTTLREHPGRWGWYQRGTAASARTLGWLLRAEGFEVTVRETRIYARWPAASPPPVDVTPASSLHVRTP